MKLAVVFNGQGAHYKEMGLDFFSHFSQARHILQIAQEQMGVNLIEWIHQSPESFDETKYAQPAIAAVSLAIYESIQSQLPPISYMAGLSLGEYSALIASGYLAFQEGIALLIQRGQLMSDFCQQLNSTTPTQMVAVRGMDYQTLEEILDSAQLENVWIANINSSQQIIVGGVIEEVRQLDQHLKEKGHRRLIPLKVEGPFHTPFMAPIRSAYAQILKNTSFHEGNIPVISNTTVKEHQLSTIRETLVDHLSQPVRWQETVDYLIKEGVTHLIQLGPGSTLVNLLRRERVPFKFMAVETVADVEKIQAFVKEKN